jgi:hypothetical protein
MPIMMTTRNVGGQVRMECSRHRNFRLGGATYLTVEKQSQHVFPNLNSLLISNAGYPRSTDLQLHGSKTHYNNSYLPYSVIISDEISLLWARNHLFSLVIVNLFGCFRERSKF